MADGSNRNDNMKKINTEALGDIVDADFFDDSEKKGDIDRFFEGSKPAPKKPAPPPIKKPSPPPMAKTFIKEEKPIEEKGVTAQPVKETAIEKTQSVTEKKLPEIAIPVTEEKKLQKKQQDESIEANRKIDITMIERFEENQEEKTPVLPQNAPFKAEIIPEPENKNEKELPTASKKEKNPFKKLAVWFKALPKKKKIAVSVIAAILALILILISVVGIFIMKKFSLIGDNINNPLYEDEEVVYNDEEYENIEIDIGSAGFKQSLIDWATTGNDKHMSSKNVINVLLIGADSRKGKNEGNTDVMMLVSVNKKAKTLKMVSFLRDSYLYIEGNNNSYCTKLNAAFSMGGPECLIETIENNYKIDIDNYVMVNFESFKDIVNEMGGISVDVQNYEANYIERVYNTDMPAGENVTLNGKQALIFCRVRNCDADGDVSRTRRQRQVIDSMVNRVMNSSISEINNYIDVFLPYVDTGYSQSQVLSLGIKAITGGWAKYERSQFSAPSEDCRTPGDANMWIWVVDYQKAAYQLQMELYGTSNIELDENRVTIIDVYRGANYSGSSTTIKENDKKDEPEVSDTTKSDAPTQNETTKPNTPITTEETTQNVTQEPSTEEITEPITEIPTTEETTEEPSTEQNNNEEETVSQVSFE